MKDTILTNNYNIHIHFLLYKIIMGAYQFLPKNAFTSEHIKLPNFVQPKDVSDKFMFKIGDQIMVSDFDHNTKINKGIVYSRFGNKVFNGSVINNMPYDGDAKCLIINDIVYTGSFNKGHFKGEKVTKGFYDFIGFYDKDKDGKIIFCSRPFR